MLWTGTSPAQRFRNSIRNLTINTGSGNAGASGIRYHANNQGSIRHVKIVSGDGKGFCGLDVSDGEVGPCLVEHLHVVGFDYAIYDHALNMVTFEHITIENQNVCGILGRQVLPIRRLVSRNRVPAIKVEKFWSVLCLIDSELLGGDPQVPAITTDLNPHYLRHVKVEGYRVALKPKQGKEVPTGMIDELVSDGKQSSYQGRGKTGLGLAIKETSEVPWEPDFTKWANPINYGAKADGKTDDTKAIQAAIDDRTKTVVYFPGGKTFRMHGDVEIRGTISRITGCEGIFRGGTQGKKRIKRGCFVFKDGTAPVVIVERIDAMYSGISIRHEASRTLVLSSTADIKQEPSTGSGDYFLSDVVGQMPELKNPKQCFWGRQLNVETKTGTNIINNGATMWILGLKTESGHTKILTRSGGRTEVIGAHIYSNPRTLPPDPLFEIIDAQASFAGIRQTWFGNMKPYNLQVRETQKGVKTELLRKNSPRGRFITLYSTKEVTKERAAGE